MSDQGKQFFRSVFSKFRNNTTPTAKLDPNAAPGADGSGVDRLFMKGKQRLNYMHSARRKIREDSASMASKMDSNDLNHLPPVYNPFLDRVKEIQKQNMTKKELHQRLIKLNGWNTADLKKGDAKLLNERMTDLANLGHYGVTIEELRLNIERRYELMMADVENKLKTIREYFMKLLDESVAEFSNNLLFHKTQNLANLKDLEKDLNSLKNKEKKKPPKGIVFDIYTDESLDNLFSFMNSFREEFFSLILSKCLLKNSEELREFLQKFKNQYLSNLVQGPKMFPSELFRYFENEVKRKNIPQSRNYGKVVTSSCPSNEFSTDFSKSQCVIETQLETKLRSPILIPINKSLFVAASHNQFVIYLDTISDRETKSTFFKEANRDASTRFLQVATGTLPTVDCEIHCGCFIKFDSSREHLFLGGNFNVAQVDPAHIPV